MILEIQEELSPKQLEFETLKHLIDTKSTTKLEYQLSTLENIENITSLREEPIFHYVVKSYDKKMIELFLEKGFDVNEKSKLNNKTILMQLCYDYEPIEDNKVFKNDSKLLDLIKYLLEQGANPNTQDLVGDTILHNLFASVSVEHKLDLLKLLIKYGANPNKKNNYEETTFSNVNECAEDYPQSLTILNNLCKKSI